MRSGDEGEKRGREKGEGGILEKFDDKNLMELMAVAKKKCLTFVKCNHMERRCCNSRSEIRELYRGI